MIGYLEGTVQDIFPSRLLLLVRGVGYEVAVPAPLASSVEKGRNLALWIHTVVRADALELFGFSSAVEKNLFRKLISVSSVGPAVGLALLSNLSAGDLVQTIRLGNAAVLAKTPRVGKKTAERICVDLASSLDQFAGLAPSPASPIRSQGPLEDIVVALTNLGFRESQAREAVQIAQQDGKSQDAQDLLRRALVNISSR